MYIRIYPCIYTYIYMHFVEGIVSTLHLARFLCIWPLQVRKFAEFPTESPSAGIARLTRYEEIHNSTTVSENGVCIVVYRGVYPKFVILTGMMITMITYYMFGHPIKQIQTALAGGQASRQKKIGQAFKILRLCSSVWFFLSLFLSDSLRGQIYSYGIPTWRRGHQRRRHPSLSAGSSVAVSESRLGPWVPGSRTLAPNLIYQRGNSLQVTTDHIKCVYYLCIQCPYLRI